MSTPTAPPDMSASSPGAKPEPVQAFWQSLSPDQRSQLNISTEHLKKCIQAAINAHLEKFTEVPTTGELYTAWVTAPEAGSERRAAIEFARTLILSSLAAQMESKDKQTALMAKQALLWEPRYNEQTKTAAFTAEERDEALVKLREAQVSLKVIAAYDKGSPHGDGVCPYGCDTPHVAQLALLSLFPVTPSPALDQEVKPKPGTVAYATALYQEMTGTKPESPTPVWTPKFRVGEWVKTTDLNQLHQISNAFYHTTLKEVAYNMVGHNDTFWVERSLIWSLPPGNWQYANTWAQKDLPEGTRPLLVTESAKTGDEEFNPISQSWEKLDAITAVNAKYLVRTRRPLPSPTPKPSSRHPLVTDELNDEVWKVYQSGITKLTPHERMIEALSYFLSNLPASAYELVYVSHDGAREGDEMGVYAAVTGPGVTWKPVQLDFKPDWAVYRRKVLRQGSTVEEMPMNLVDSPEPYDEDAVQPDLEEMQKRIDWANGIMKAQAAQLRDKITANGVYFRKWTASAKENVALKAERDSLRQRAEKAEANSLLFSTDYDKCSKDRESLRQQLASLQSRLEWVPMSERMPTKDDCDFVGRVLVVSVDRASYYEMWDNINPAFQRYWLAIPPLPPSPPSLREEFEREWAGFGYLAMNKEEAWNFWQAAANSISVGASRNRREEA